MTTDKTPIDHKAALETATKWAGLSDEDVANPPAANLAACYLDATEELRRVKELARAVADQCEGPEPWPEREALREAIKEE